MFRSFTDVVVAVVVFALLPMVVSCQGDADAADADANGKASPAALTSPPPRTPEARRADALYAYIDASRADLSDGKAQLINQVMRLTREESAEFWPIYHEYEDELFELGDKRVELSRQFVVSQAADTFDDQRAAALADEWFKIENERLDLLRKYHKRIADELSPLRAVQFTQIEHRVGTLTDLIIASELPLVRTDPRAAQR